MLAWRNMQYEAGIGAECLLRMLQGQAWLVVGYGDSLPVGGAVAVSSANRSAVRWTRSSPQRYVSLPTWFMRIRTCSQLTLPHGDL